MGSQTYMLQGLKKVTRGNKGHDELMQMVFAIERLKSLGDAMSDAVSTLVDSTDDGDCLLPDSLKAARIRIFVADVEAALRQAETDKEYLRSRL